jgi:hypothetical protein
MAFYTNQARHSPGTQIQTRGVSHCGHAIHIQKYLKAKEEELWKLKYFTMQKYNLPKNPLKETNKNPSR